MSFYRIAEKCVVATLPDDKDGEILKNLAKDLSLEITVRGKLEAILFSDEDNAESFFKLYQRAVLGW